MHNIQFLGIHGPLWGKMTNPRNVVEPWLKAYEGRLPLITLPDANKVVSTLQVQIGENWAPERTWYSGLQVDIGGLGLPRACLSHTVETKLFTGQASLKDLLLGPLDKGIM